MTASVSSDVDRYAAFFTPQRRATVSRPTSDWWHWRSHRVHLLRHRDPSARVRLLVVHGAGAHGAALWPIASALTHAPTLTTALDVTAVDLPLYGRTKTSVPHRVRYLDWIELVGDLLAAEDDGRPLILLGGSIGGLLAVEVAARSIGARTGKVSAVAATCLLNPRDRGARDQMTRFGKLARAVMPFLSLVKGPVARLPINIATVAPLSRMGRDPKLGRVCAADPRGGGAKVPMGFMASYLSHSHVAAFNASVPVTLLHPQLDDWTPMALSLDTLRALPGPTTSHTLSNCGHFPLEEPGVQQLIDVISDMAASVDRST